jgi:hypothetical protein
MQGSIATERNDRGQDNQVQLIVLLCLSRTYTAASFYPISSDDRFPPVIDLALTSQERL